MPWVNDELCTGCGICAESCPAEAISMGDKVAYIDMGSCIRCGRCHDICPEQAVMHDGKRISQDVAANVERARNAMAVCAEHFNDPAEAGDCLQRWLKNYNREKTIAEKTIEELQKILSTL